MSRVLWAIAAALVVGVGGTVVHLYSGMNAFRVVEVGDDVHVIEVERLGGNVGVLATGQGAVVVDTMTFRFQGEQLLEMAERLGRGPVQAVINTHYHQDHTHGNSAFPAGTKVIATRRTRDYLLHFDGEAWQGDARDLLPNETFDDVSELRVGQKTIRSLHPGRGHTGGDLVVHFVEDRVIHAGDLVFHERYPNIDLEGGGSLREWIATLDRVLELDFERVIPGHGAVTGREGLAGFQRFLRELWAVGEEAAREGLSLEDTLARAELGEDRGYQVISFPLVFRLDRDFAIRRAWEEATGAVRPQAVPAS